MLQRYLLLLCGLSLPLVVWAFADWQSYSVDEHLSLHLPAPPQEVDLAKHGIKVPGMRMFMTTDEVSIYQVTRIELPTDKTEFIRTPADLQVFYNSMQQTMLSDIKGQLLASSEFHTAAGDGVELKFRAPFGGGTGKNIGYYRAVLAKNTAYCFMFIPRSLADSTSSRAAELRQRFFSSITVGAAAPPTK